MAKTAIIFSPIYYDHNPGRAHPEKAKRLKAIVKELEQNMLLTGGNCQIIAPTKASIDEVGLVHNIAYVKYVKDLCESGGGTLDVGDTVVSRRSFDVALNAVGGTLKAVRLIMKKQFDNAFALVRPPGHHAGVSYGLGFCIFNNTAIAAQYLLRRMYLDRVLILDIDAHHGNGSQQIFWKTDKVLYLSLHEDPCEFPRTGFVDEIGKGKGRGFTINIPLPSRTGDRIYLEAFEDIAVPIIQQYAPQFFLVSAGLDCHYADPVGRLSLSTLCYERVFTMIVQLASKICNGRLALVLEGGYNPIFAGKIAAAAAARMSNQKYRVNDKVQVSDKRKMKQGKRVIDEVKRVQKCFWSLG